MGNMGLIFEFDYDVEGEIKDWANSYRALEKEALKLVIDSVEIDGLSVDNEQMVSFKLGLQALELLNKALTIAEHQSKQIQDTYEASKKLIEMAERQGARLTNIEEAQKRLDTRFDSLGKASKG